MLVTVIVCEPELFGTVVKLEPVPLEGLPVGADHEYAPSPPVALKETEVLRGTLLCEEGEQITGGGVPTVTVTLALADPPAPVQVKV